MRRRVGVVRLHAHSVQCARQKRQTLLPCCLNAADVSAGAVYQSRFCRALKRQDDVIYRISESFVEKASLNDAQRLQIVLQQHIEILCMRRFEVRVSLGEYRSRRRVIDKVWSDVPEVGASNAHAVRSAQDRVGSDPILSLYAREN